jgi:hypothetical protein
LQRKGQGLRSCNGKLTLSKESRQSICLRYSLTPKLLIKLQFTTEKSNAHIFPVGGSKPFLYDHNLKFVILCHSTN